MTDLIAGQIITLRRRSLPRLKVPTLNVGGRLMRLCLAYGDAFSMALEPFSGSPNRRNLSRSERGEDGRDPRW